MRGVLVVLKRVKILSHAHSPVKKTPIHVRILQLEISRSRKFHEGEQKHKSISLASI